MSSPSLPHLISEKRRRSAGSFDDVESTASISTASGRLKLKRLQSAQLETGVWLCKNCGYRYGECRPDHRVRKEHKKICPGARSRLRQSEEGDASLLAAEGSVRAEKEPTEESQRVSREDEGIEELVDVHTAESGIADGREVVEERPEVPSSITEDVSSASDHHTLDSLHFETLQSWQERGGGGERSSAAEQRPQAGGLDDRAQGSSKYEVARGAVEEEREHGSIEYEVPREDLRIDSGGDGLLEGEERLLHGYGSRGTSVTEDYDSEYLDQYVRETEILSSDDGGSEFHERESLQTEEDEDYPEVDESTTGGEESSLTKGTPRARPRDVVPSEISEITPAEDGERGTKTTVTTASPRAQGREEDFDVALILRKQSVFDIFCPVCGGDITRRIIARKKQRSFVSKEEGLRRRGAVLRASTGTSASGEQQQQQQQQEYTEENGRKTSSVVDPDSDDEDMTWLEKCLGYFYGQFRTSPPLKMVPDRPTEAPDVPGASH